MRIAVIGAGISGLVAAYVLARDHEVVLYEAASRPGGHTNTIDVPLPDGRRRPVDTGFIVFNEPNYPGFCRLLEQLQVASRPSDMSFSVQSERTGLEYCGSGLDTLFAQRRNLLRPRVWRMLRGILRFNREAPERLRDASYELTLGTFLEQEGYGPELLEHYIVPMGAAVWSARPDGILEFPARTFVEFFENHAFLKLKGRPVWRTIEGGSRTYVDALLERFGGEVRLGAAVRGVRRPAEGGVRLRVEGEAEASFDHAVLAVHGDIASRMLLDPSPAEEEVLGAFAFQENETILHTDERLMPRTRKAWASWNYFVPAASAERAAVTYHMNRLQGLEGPTQCFVTLNRTEAIREDRILERIVYDHPIFTPATHAAQQRWAEVSGVRSTHYCGAWWGYGFHEDGVQSALRVCRALGSDLG